MKDVQSLPDTRRINIKKVGVKNISYPITVLDKARRVQRTVATVNMYVNLPHHFKGTHMSRFVEILNRFHGEINLQSLQAILQEMKTRLQAEAAHLEITFPYFLRKVTQTANAMGKAEYQCTMHGSLGQENELTLTVEVPISPPLPSQTEGSLPRSLGRWGTAKVSLRFLHFIWIEDLIQLVEEVTSQHLGSTAAGQAERGLSVEKVTRALGDKLVGHPHLQWFVVRVENLAAGFTTFATLEWPEQEVILRPPNRQPSSLSEHVTRAAS